MNFEFLSRFKINLLKIIKNVSILTKTFLSSIFFINIEMIYSFILFKQHLFISLFPEIGIDNHKLWTFRENRQKRK